MSRYAIAIRIFSSRVNCLRPYTYECQVLGEVIYITTEYLTHEEKAAMASLKVGALEAESSKQRKELISAMDEGNTAEEKVEALTEELRVEKLLTMKKDE